LKTVLYGCKASLLSVGEEKSQVSENKVPRKYLYLRGTENRWEKEDVT